MHQVPADFLYNSQKYASVLLALSVVEGKIEGKQTERGRPRSYMDQKKDKLVVSCQEVRVMT